MDNNTKVQIAWKEPSSVNGVIQSYFVAYTMDLVEAMTTWRNVTVPGNRTLAVLPGLAPGKQYFVVVRAATKAGYGKPSNPIRIITGGSSAGIGGAVNGGASKVPISPGKQKPPQNAKPDQSLGKRDTFQRDD